jgi:hypothetical protein
MFNAQKGHQDVKMLRQGISWVANPWRTSEAQEDKMDKGQGQQTQSIFYVPCSKRTSRCQDVKMLRQGISWVAHPWRTSEALEDKMDKRQGTQSIFYVQCSKRMSSY